MPWGHTEEPGVPWGHTEEPGVPWGHKESDTAAGQQCLPKRLSLSDKGCYHLTSYHFKALILLSEPQEKCPQK